MNGDATVQVPPFSMRFSSFASQESKEAAVRHYVAEAEFWSATNELPVNDVPTQRKRVDEAFFRPLLEKQELRWAEQVEISDTEINGVHVDVFSPKKVAPASNSSRVLINLHGGGFQVGSGICAAVESIPIAGLGKFKVISVDYRMFPEYRFPAASEDVARVYEGLLAEYKPENIAIYGSSAGGILAAQAVAWFLEHDLPLPGAIGMFGGTGQRFRGDSATLAMHVFSAAAARLGDDFFPDDMPLESAMPYFTAADVGSPLVSPMLFPEVLEQFPPSLLITGSRAHEMSTMIDAHNKLVLAGASARLHMWDGLGHCFYMDADLPESHEAEQIIVGFFDETLGRS